MSGTTWTNDVPTRSGLYWIRDSYNCTRVVRLERASDGFCYSVFEFGKQEPVHLHDYPCEWWPVEGCTFPREDGEEGRFASADSALDAVFKHNSVADNLAAFQLAWIPQEKRWGCRVVVALGLETVEYDTDPLAAAWRALERTFPAADRGPDSIEITDLL